MKVTQKMTMRDYDAHVSQDLREKLPELDHPDWRRRLGDALYAFNGESVTQRPGVHEEGNKTTDLSGKFALLSNDFYYFGANAVALPAELQDIAQNQQGHRVPLNAPYVAAFEDWIRRQPRGVNGDPLLRLFDGETDDASTWCAGCRLREDAEDGDD